MLGRCEVGAGRAGAVPTAPGSLALSTGSAVCRRLWKYRWRVTVRPITDSWPASEMRSMRNRRPLMS